jgi:DNA-binding MarR family transcriptional regulator
VNAIAGLEATRGCHCLIARKSARALTRHYEEYLRPHGLRATQFSILAALALKGATPVGELADLRGLDRTTLTRSAALLQSRGLTASGGSEDGRERLLRITDAGLEKLEAALPAWQRAQETAGISAKPSQPIES